MKMKFEREGFKIHIHYLSEIQRHPPHPGHRAEHLSLLNLSHLFSKKNK
jgi:hypothetical protein